MLITKIHKNLSTRNCGGLKKCTMLRIYTVKLLQMHFDNKNLHIREDSIIGAGQIELHSTRISSVLLHILTVSWWI